MTLTGRSRPLVFTEGVLQQTASRTYQCAGNGDTKPWVDADGATHRERRRAPRCRGKIQGTDRVTRMGWIGEAHLRRGRQRHCGRCAAMFFVDAEASYPAIRWTPCRHCGKDYMLRRTCHAPGKNGWRVVQHPQYDPSHDSFHVSYNGSCACAGATKERDEVRRLNDEMQKRLAPFMARFAMSRPTGGRRR